jgi:glycosyltransferase involved in cell wall biosynthesis
VFVYNNLPKYINNAFRYNKIERNAIKKYDVAIIYTEDETDCLLAEYTKNLVYSLKSIENFTSAYSLHVFVLQRNNQSRKCKFSEPFVRDVFIGDQPSPELIESLVKFINKTGFVSVVILQKSEFASKMWKLAELGSKLSLNIKVYYVLHSTLVNPNLETIGLVRHMENHAAHLIVMSWFDYHTLIHTYGIQENKILHIPHGVSIPNLTEIDTNLKSIQSLLKYTDQDFVLLSTDTIDPNEDFKRLLIGLKLIIANISNLHLLIVSREPLMNTSIMQKFLERVKSLQLEDRVTWINKYMSTEELNVVYKRANAYISFFDKIVLSPGSFLNAMAYALPIISTPHILAIETLKQNRGLIIPFDDDKVKADSIIQFLKNPTLMNTFRINAREFVKNWRWDNIAKQYTILFKNRLFTTIEATKSFMRALTNDPYENETVLIDIKKPAYWTNTGAMSFDHQDVLSSMKQEKVEPGIYTLYVDSFLQLNGKINKNYQIEMIGLKTINQYVVVNRHEGIEEFKINKQNFTNPFQINYTDENIVFASNNIYLEISRSKEEITIQFLKVNGFTNAFGLLGTTIRQTKFFERNLIIQAIRPLKWFIGDQDIFSHSAEGQRLSMYGMEYNIFILYKSIVMQYLQSNSTKIKLIMEVSYIDGSSADSVNRKMFLSLVENNDFFISIKSSDRKLPQHNVGLESLIAYSLLLRQETYLKIYQNTVYHQLTTYKDKTIIFRTDWPPNTNDVSDKEILIHQQPMEFHAVPKQWANHFQHEAEELWVPSQYCKNSYIANGISDSKIHVIPHGIFMEKYQRKLLPLELPTKKTFKFLSVGGMLSRKGFDLLYQSYLNLFSSKDDVTLIIHAIYGDDSADAAMNKFKINSTSPEIIQLGYYMPDIDIIRLFKSVDVYVSPYRGEGFGLTILEAMATGLPPIVTKYGPSLEFCPEDCAYFVEAQETECRTHHCGNMTLFGYKTVVQAKWAEPNIESLSAQMYLAYTDRVQLRKKSKICQKYAENYTWDKIADKIIKRISEITK